MLYKGGEAAPRHPEVWNGGQVLRRDESEWAIGAWQLPAHAAGQPSPLRISAAPRDLGRTEQMPSCQHPHFWGDATCLTLLV